MNSEAQPETHLVSDQFQINSDTLNVVYSDDIVIGPPIVNQSGYNLHEAKRFTVPGAVDGTHFQIYRYQPPDLGHVQPGIGSEVLYSGTIQDEVGYFTDYNPVSSQDKHVIVVEGHGHSNPFWIADHLMEKLSSRLAYQFFIDVRGGQDPGISPARITGGGPSRDGGGQTVEALFAIMLYASNPALFDRWTDELKPGDRSDLIDLILWYAEFCYNNLAYDGSAGGKSPNYRGYEDWIRQFGYEGQDKMQSFDYQNMLDQLAAVVGAYHSFLKPQMSWDTYERYRQAALTLWEQYDRHKVVRYWVKSEKWIDEGWQEFSEQGNAYGQAVFRNLFMYFAEREEEDGEPERFLKYAQNAAQDIIENWDFENPWHMWKMRNAEHVTPQALAYFLIAAPEHAPEGTREKLAEWRDYMTGRTDNLWQYRKHDDKEWAHPQSKEVGTVAGMGGSAFTVAHVLDDSKLREIGWSQVNFVFGLNPVARHLSNKSQERVEIGGYWLGVERGWPDAMMHGTGELKLVRGTLDGSPVNAAFPYNPELYAGGDDVLSYYATEGWSITNRAWMSTVTFSTLDSHELRILSSSGQPLQEVRAGDTISVELRAALNNDWNEVETGWVLVSYGNKEKKIIVKETGNNTGLFRTDYTIPNQTGPITFSYGYLGFEKKVSIQIEI